ncbi:MAG: phosphoglucomutase/phosphomannomutase family protein [Deltaproteobacteria bacterium]|nr:phosphoglucomutase/phosphomannomutase family protein [Deltaproteobacteria bacterium]
MTEIKFGTDGWRAVIDRDFNAQNVARVVQGFCDVKQAEKNRLVYVGYDRRKMSNSMAALAAQILAANGFDVKLSNQFCPTPCISWMVKTTHALAGVVITASHNPAQWNGVKFKEATGCAASTEFTREIEHQIQKNTTDKRAPLTGNFADLLQSRRIVYFDPMGDYVDHLKKFVDVPLINSQNYRIVYDPLFGSGAGFIGRVLGTEITQIHAEDDVTFGGLNPEPIAQNTALLREEVLEHGAHIGLATDGDADRIGAFDEKGAFVNSHQIFALLLLHNLRYRGGSGAVVKSITTTELIRKICDKAGMDLIETPVGFKYISQELIKHNALMGGEESGGISIREHVHERDGVLNALLLLEIMAVNGKSLSEMICAMDAEFGKFFYMRNDYHLAREKINQIDAEARRQQIAEVGGVPVSRYDLMDGVKIYFADYSWLFIRASGTEPLLRVYSEATSVERVNLLLDFARVHFGL